MKVAEQNYEAPVHLCQGCENVTVTLCVHSSSSSGAEPPLIGGFGLLNDILPLCSILDTG